MIYFISWTFLNDAMAISAKELLKNHTDKERFTAASSCDGNLNFTFSLVTRMVSVSAHILVGNVPRILQVST